MTSIKEVSSKFKIQKKIRVYAIDPIKYCQSKAADGTMHQKLLSEKYAANDKNIKPVEDLEIRHRNLQASIQYKYGRACPEKTKQTIVSFPS